MPFKYETKRVEMWRTNLPVPTVLGNVPRRVYDAQFARFSDVAPGENLEARATELAELTLQRNGSAYEGYQSITRHEPFKLATYVSSVNTNDDFLIIGDAMDADGNIIAPARLSLQDLVGYETLKKVERETKLVAAR